MKKLLKKLGKFEKTSQIKLSKWTRNILYNVITEHAINIRDNHEFGEITRNLNQTTKT